MDKRIVKKKMLIYDKFCDAADKIMDIWGNLCKVKNGNCLRKDPSGTCCMNVYPHKKNPHCPHLGNDGCMTRCLACKLFFCEYIKKKHPMLAEIMRCLEYKAKEYFPNIPFRMSIEDFKKMLMKN